MSVAGLLDALAEGDPPIAVSQNYLHQKAIGIVASTLKPANAAVVGHRLRALFGRA